MVPDTGFKPAAGEKSPMTYEVIPFGHSGNPAFVLLQINYVKKQKEDRKCSIFFLINNFFD